MKHLLETPAPQTAKPRLLSLAAIFPTGALLIPMAKGQRREGSKSSGRSSGLEAGSGSNPTRSGAGLAPGSILAITLVKSEPYFYLGSRAVTLDELKKELERATANDPNAGLSIRADSAAPTGKIVELMDAVKSAGLKVTLFTDPKAGQIEGEVQNGKTVQVGVALGVAPKVNADSVGLRLRLRLGNLSDSNAPFATQPPADLFDPSSRFVLSTNFTVPNGKTAIVGSYVASQNSGTNYVIFVTPKLVAPDKVPSKP